MKVDFPEPDGPITATNSPRSIVTVTPRSAWAGDAATPVVTRDAGHLVVASLLLRREDLANPHARRVAELLRSRAPLGLRQPGGLERHELLATVLEDRLELLLLVRAELEVPDEPVTRLLE